MTTIDHEQEALITRYSTTAGMERVIISHLLRFPDARIYSVITNCGLGEDARYAHASTFVDIYVHACQNMIEQKLIRLVRKTGENDPIINYALPKMLPRYHMIRNRRRMMDAWL